MTANDCTPGNRQRRIGVAAASPTGAELAQTYDDVSRVIDALEAADWRRVPGFSPAEAAAVTVRLDESRETLATHLGDQP